MSEASDLGEAYLQPRNEGIPIGEACGGWSIQASQERRDEAVRHFLKMLTIIRWLPFDPMD